MRMLRALSGVLLLILATSVQAAEWRDPNTHFFDQTFGDLSEELQNAKAAGKKGVMIMFEMDECPFCHRMKQQVLSRPDVQAYFKENFLLLHIDIEGDVEITDFLGQPTTMKQFAVVHRVRATPVFQFFDLEGQPVKRGRYTGATRDEQEFILLGRYIAEGIYAQEPFTRYKRAQKNN
jgi:thioredoxin-related protein